VTRSRAGKQELARAAQEIDEHLRRVRRILRQPLETEFARGGLTGPQRSVMQAVVHANGMSLKDLSRSVGLAHSTVSGIVDRLVKKGLLARQSDKKDRRLSLIVPSRQVREYVRNKLPALTIHPLQEALRRTRPAELAAILDGLRILRRAVESNMQ
jgi:DNA-binding MarR family transcriptional regulator